MTANRNFFMVGLTVFNTKLQCMFIIIHCIISASKKDKTNFHILEIVSYHDKL